jgi:hypothetical protein
MTPGTSRNCPENTLLIGARNHTGELYDAFLHPGGNGLRILHDMAQAATHALQEHLIGYIFLPMKQ